MKVEPYRMSAVRKKVNWTRNDFAFGTDRVSSGSNNDYKFTSNDYDPETGLYYIWHRYYDPNLGRFTQVDPKWDAYPGWSPYAYALNNPLVVIDPTGEAGFRITGGAYGIAGFGNIRLTGSIGIDFQRGIYIAGTVGLGGATSSKIVTAGLMGSVGIVPQTIQSGKSAYIFGGIETFQITGQIPLEKLNKISSTVDAKNLTSAAKNSSLEAGLTTPTAPVVAAGVQTEGVIMIIPFSGSTKSIPLNASTGDSPPDATRVILEIDPADPHENWLLEHEDEIEK